MKYAEIETWADLKKALDTATEEQLQQMVQIVDGSPVSDHVHECKVGIVIGTVDELEILYCRSAADNKRHGEELVIFTDGNPHGIDGATSYMMGEIDPDADWLNNMVPVYPNNHCPDGDWVNGTAIESADKEQLERDVGKGTLNVIIQNRIKNM